MTPSPKAAEALARARRGDLAGAVRAGEEAVRESPGDSGLRLFLGTLSARSGDLDRAIGHFQAARALAPSHPLVLVELGRALLAVEDWEALDALTGDGADLATPLAREMARLKGLAAQRRDQPDVAERLFGALSERDADDFESWQGLGLARFARGDHTGAVIALQRAVRLRSGLAKAQGTLGRALLALDRPGEALDALCIAERLDPIAIDTPMAIAQAAVRLLRFEEAEAAMRRALAIDPDHTVALSRLADLLERANRPDDAESLLDVATARGIADPALRLARARLLRRRGRLDEALAMARADEDDDALRAQTIGEIADRLHDVPVAFAAFERMNALDRAGHPSAETDALEFRELLRRMARLTTPTWEDEWREIGDPRDGRPDPAFLFGFPRSGTTLLDTMLMGHSDVVVLEELPFLQRVADRMKDVAQIGDLTAGERDALRAFYWQQVETADPAAAGKLVVDKLPLGLAGLPFIRRLFPDARFIFAERHPCDCVLSCFINRFRLNPGMANFLRLEDSARLYDLAIGYWEQARSAFDLPTHRVRYERMIADAEAELRPLADFLGLGWTDRLIDHRGSAAKRDYINTPSYAQVTEPLYTRARGRWRRYAEQMAPVMPILAPWVERMGYDL